MKKDKNQENYKYNKVKKRYWTCVLYPESAPENWREILTKTGLQVAISPLHDKDVNPDEEIKKAHYHLILCFTGPTTGNVVKGITDSLNCPAPGPIESVRGLYRYFTHKDNPEKYQYDEKDIKLFNGFDISSYVSLTKEEKYEAIGKIMDIINENGITEYIDLLNILRVNDYNLFKVACDNTILFTNVVRSLRHSEDKRKRF